MMPGKNAAKEESSWLAPRLTIRGNAERVGAVQCGEEKALRGYFSHQCPILPPCPPEWGG